VSALPHRVEVGIGMTNKTAIINTVRDIEACKHDMTIGGAFAGAGLLGAFLFRWSADAILPCILGLLGACTAYRGWKKKKPLEKKLREM